MADAIVSAAEKQGRYVRPGPTSVMNTLQKPSRTGRIHGTGGVEAAPPSSQS